MSGHVGNRKFQLLNLIAKKFQPIFLGSGYMIRLFCGDCTTCGFVRNQRWWPVTGIGLDIMHSSDRILDSNEFSTTVLMFSGSGNKTKLPRKPFDMWSCKESKMALSNFRLTNDIVNSQLIYTSGGLRSSLFV